MITARPVYWLAIVGCCALSAAAQADCTYPQAPSSIPDGKTATKEEMISAMTQFKQYNADATAYMACLEEEKNERMKDKSVSTSVLMEIKAMHARKHNAAISELKSKADKFNEQVMVFKGRST